MKSRYRLGGIKRYTGSKLRVSMRRHDDGICAVGSNASSSFVRHGDCLLYLSGSLGHDHPFRG